MKALKQRMEKRSTVLDAEFASLGIMIVQMISLMRTYPLAHILLPPNTATTGGCGETVQYQGGEVVVGFFHGW